jgi:phosphoserine aminotransferase
MLSTSATGPHLRLLSRAAGPAAVPSKGLEEMAASPATVAAVQVGVGELSRREPQSESAVQKFSLYVIAQFK